jgi:putative membrane protein
VNGLDNADITFLKNAAAANIFEISSARLAAQKSQDPFVLEFAKEMIADHMSSLEEVKQIADKKGVSLPQNLPWSLQHAMDHLMNQSGATFDAAYENAQRYGHEDASRLFKSEIENGRDEDVKAYAVKTLPTVTMHYKMMLTHTTEMGPTQMKGGG